MYQIVKGWPSSGALDEVLAPATGQTVEPGMIVSLHTDGKANVATLAAGGTDQAFFVIGKDTLTGTLTGLAGNFMVEVDAEHLAAAAASYSVNELLTATDGKFAAIATTEQAVARVRSVDAITGKVRIVWLGN